jgi:lipopolysaccharide/colanic/teichoic acid biosynthesis glycosyltransferase
VLSPSDVPIWKRTLDIAGSLVGLVLLSPVLLMAAVLIKLDSKGTVLFRQERIGQGLRAFMILKFRTMRADASGHGALLTADCDPRITRVGQILRNTKIDELPQLVNVLRGEMSLVGPRPEVRRYVALFRTDYEEILRVAPGMTDLASLKYIDDSRVHGLAADPEHEYVTRVLPDKIALAKEYVRRSSLGFDLSLIFKTVLKIFTDRRRS